MIPVRFPLPGMTGRLSCRQGSCCVRLFGLHGSRQTGPGRAIRKQEAKTAAERETREGKKEQRKHIIIGPGSSFPGSHYRQSPVTRCDSCSACRDAQSVAIEWVRSRSESGVTQYARTRLRAKSISQHWQQSRSRRSGESVTRVTARLV